MLQVFENRRISGKTPQLFVDFQEFYEQFQKNQDKTFKILYNDLKTIVAESIH